MQRIFKLFTGIIDRVNRLVEAGLKRGRQPKELCPKWD